ncbi:hypothetical protein J4232_01270 [Candidatus Woesearchaeota archaeon]|nr:hypothetical protein [Candidatus Woesearchaeota archaeon]
MKLLTRKSQLKIGETIFVLMIFFILVTIGAVFYVKIQSISAGDEQKKQLELHTLKIAQQVKSLPELICTQAAIEEFDCIDKLKFEAFKSRLEDTSDKSKKFKQYYDNIFLNVKISIKEVYPTYTASSENSEEVDTTIEKKDNLFDNMLKNVKSINSMFLPITFYDPITNQYSFGYIRIEVAK